MKRRHFLLGAGVAAVGAAVGLRSGDEGGPHDAYFSALNAELKKNGPMRPCLIVDLDRLDHNIAAVKRVVNGPKQLRIVEKSLPSAPLLEYLMQQSGTNRLMSFHQPFLNADAKLFPQSDLLVGKPLPVRSAALFYAQHSGSFDPARQLQWLVDTPERVQQYLELAQGLGTTLRLNVEIDVGLHRGGVADNETLGAMLALMAAHPQQLEFSGFMGYDPHVVKVPGIIASRDALLAQVMQAYQGFVDFTRREYAPLWNERLTLNTAGSPTYVLHQAETLSNDIAIGSGFVKGTDFDLDTLAAHQPAAFIATPVLKTMPQGIAIPGLGEKSRWLTRWDPNQQHGYFIYGGYWMAHYESPRGLRRNGMYGRSSNQENITGSAAMNLQVDDQIFLRPTQSEAVLLQFGDLVAVRGGKIQAYWPVLA